MAENSKETSGLDSASDKPRQDYQSTLKGESSKTSLTGEGGRKEEGDDKEGDDEEEKDETQEIFEKVFIRQQNDDFFKVAIDHTSPLGRAKIKKQKSAELLKNHEFDATKSQSQHVWSSLPDSINGTLIYFMLVEHNAKTFPVFDILRWLITLGLPVYFSFYMQGLLIYWIYTISPDFIDSPLCGTDAYLQHAVICIFFIFM